MLFPASDASTVNSLRLFRKIGEETPQRTFNAFDWKTGITEDGDAHRQESGGGGRREIPPGD